MLGSPAAVEALRRFDTVLVGGAAVESSLRQRAADAGVRVVATYGMSETCGGCVYDGMPLDGVAVAVGRDGRVRIAGPVLFDGYDGRPDLTAEVMRDGWFSTSDLGRLDDDGRLEVLGRVDDVVVSGGVKVPAAAVARRLREHPSLSAAEVVGAPDSEWGQRVVAVVVSRDAPALDELRDWVSAVHPREWAPREVVAVDEIPLLPNGKVDRLALERLAHA
jgi:O-succinylbenzoic acid--CoA ligase